jgi:hypothetical protein
MLRDGSMLTEPGLIVRMSLEGHPPETGGAHLDQPAVLKGTQSLRIIAVTSQDLDVKEAERGQIGQDRTTARRARFPMLESLAARPSDHEGIVSRVQSGACLGH